MSIGTPFNIDCRMWILGSILLFLSILFPIMSQAIGINLEGRTSFEGRPAGVIRDIEVKGDVVFIAAENGVFEITGAYSQSLEFNREGETTGIISDIQLDGKYLWVVEYGVGVFQIDLNTRKARAMFTDHSWSSDIWALNVSEQRVVLSLINDILIVDKNDNSLIRLSKHLKKIKISDAYALNSTPSGTWVSSAAGFIFVPIHSKTSEEYPLNEYFPQLDYATFAKEIDGVNYFGGRGGLYINDRESKTPIFIKNEKTEDTYIHDIYKSQKGSIWVSDGSLKKLENNKLSAPSFLNPILASESVRTVTKIAEGPQRTLLVASSQLGLLSLSSAIEAVNLVSIDDIVLQGNINHAFQYQKSTLVTLEAGVFELDLSTGKLFPNTVEEFHADSCSPDLYFIFENIVGFHLSTRCDFQYLHVVKNGKDSFYLYQDDGNEAFYYLVKENQVIDKYEAPRFVRESIVLSSGEIASFDVYDNVHFQLSKFNWRTIGVKEGNWPGIQCLIELPTEYLVCSSGGGIRSINKKSGEIGLAKEFSIDGLRFIRDAILTKNGNFWAATNMGLYMARIGEIAPIRIQSSHGIFDKDFEYNSFIELSDRLLVKGDKYTYLVDEKKLLEEASIERNNLPTALLTSIEWSDSYGAYNKFFPKYMNLEFGNTFKEINLNYTSNSFLAANEHKLEFKIDSVSEEWALHQSPLLSISLSDLKHGWHNVQVRVVAAMGRGPSSSFTFYIAPPFWASTGGVIFYAFVLMTLFLLSKLGFISKFLNLFKSTRLYANLTRYEITDGQSKFEKMLRSKERFIDEVTTELRTPIQVIKGSLDDLSNSRKENSKQLICIQENMRRVEQLVEHMRSGAPQAEKVANYYKLYSPEDIKFIANSLATLAKPKRQNLEVKLRGKKSVSLVNDSLEKILTHLIQNAVKFTPAQGNIKVTITIDSKTLKIIVSDDGVGINEQILERIFERFIKEHEQEEGEGIGLAVVKNLIELNQGTISVESKKGEGSKFSILLPVDDIEFVNSNAEIIDSSNRTSTRKTLLIVDNSREFRTYMFDLLSKKYRCLVAKNGQQALEVMQHFLVDLVITEQIMPIMDGITLTKEIRSQVNHMNTPVLMLSAKTDPELEKSALESKVDYFLPKPASNEEILLRVEHLLAVRETQGRDGQISAKPKFEFVCLDIPEFTNEKDMAFYLNFIAVLEKNYHKENFNRNQAAEQLLMSTRSLNRRLSELFDYNFSEFLSRYRIEKSIPLLLEGRTILDACLDVGYGTAAYFSTSFKKIMKMPPKRFVEQYNEKHGRKPDAKS